MTRQYLRYGALLHCFRCGDTTFRKFGTVVYAEGGRLQRLKCVECGSLNTMDGLVECNEQ